MRVCLVDVALAGPAHAVDTFASVAAAKYLEMPWGPQIVIYRDLRVIRGSVVRTACDINTIAQHHPALIRGRPAWAYHFVDETVVHLLGEVQ